MENDVNNPVETGQPTYNYNQTSNQFSPGKIPNSDVVLALGIASIVACFCYGLIGLILGIVAIVLGSKAKKEYRLYPDQYSQSSFQNLNAGYICAIIGTCLSSLFILFIIAYIIFFGAMFLGSQGLNLFK
jgi:hypothetical protein